ncbi:MAG: alanine racemase [Propionibacteriaceae bacterium]|nr:alanine racemase [Micropruina sp.]
MLYPTVATTDLGNIRANLEAIRARVGERLVLAAVKADGYGHGAVAVSQMIEATGAADWLGVATVPEGLELREAGVTLPILKFSPAPDDAIETALRAGITLSVVDAETIDAVAAVASALGLKVAVHLKVDTGMRRIGSPVADAVELIRRIGAAPSLVAEGLFSHLPISDDPSGDAFTRGQIAQLREVADASAADRGAPIPLVHLANSGAVLGHPDAWFDLVRPGIMLYGSYPDPACAKTVELRPGLRWTSEVTFVKRVSAGETVGYGRSWTAPRDTWIATVCVGYGDGYSRLLSNRGRMLIDGVSYPIAGRVCMDQTMLDLGAETSVRVGDEVVLLGTSGADEITTAELAALMGTITYEVTCLITARVGRSTIG